jgi:hypothetical protein
MGNSLLYPSKVANAAWTRDTGVTTTDTDSTDCPADPVTGSGGYLSLVTSPGSGKGVYQDAAGADARAAWLSLATGDSACNITLADFAGSGPKTIALGAIPARYYGGPNAPFLGQHGIAVTQAASSGCARWCQWGATARPWNQGGSPDAGAFVDVADTPIGVSMPSLSTPSAWVNSNRNAWELTFSLLSWSQTNSSINIWTVGSSFIGKMTTNLAYWVYDQAGGSTQNYIPATFAAGSEHVWSGQLQDGAISIYIDGAFQTKTVFGSGTNIVSALPSTVIFGSDGGYYAMSGAIHSWKQCSRLVNGRCP